MTNSKESLCSNSDTLPSANGHSNSDCRRTGGAEPGGERECVAPARLENLFKWINANDGIYLIS
jgi:hypothetical protein